jgi:hypothetical protein
MSPEEAAITREYQIDRRNSHLRLDAEIDAAFARSFNVARVRADGSKQPYYIRPVEGCELCDCGPLG